MAKDIVVKKDTIAGKKVINQTYYKYSVDSVYLRKKQEEQRTLDSLLSVKKKKIGGN